MDGVDAALFQISPKDQPTSPSPALAIQLLSSILYPFESGFQRQLTRMISCGQASLESITAVNFVLGEIFAQAANKLLKDSQVHPSEIDLIGSHGQTIWHLPKRCSSWGVGTTGTLQLGEPAVIAARTGIPVIGDFRVQDIAFGGQGAPLVAFADEVLFGQTKEAVGILNLGGIANITVLAGTGEAVMAFDTGPGNMIIDRAAQVLFGYSQDTNGLLAAQGTVDNTWLAKLLQDPYFAHNPPKTTGREAFGSQFADNLIAAGKSFGLTQHSIMATLTALTAFSVAASYESFVLPQLKLKRLILGGGGTENVTLRNMLLQCWPHPIELNRHEDFGISSKFKEALLFALLAYTTFFGIPNNVPRCTGASRRVCLGKLCHPCP